MRSEDYERGYFVATQRAISRQELGLPLDRSATDDELQQLSRKTRWMSLPGGGLTACVPAYFEQAKTVEG